MNKIYFDTKQNKEVVDLSGLKTIEQINREFNGDFVDITQEREDMDAQNVVLQRVDTDKEQLIQAKIRDIAIEALVAEGKLDVNGKVI